MTLQALKIVWIDLQGTWILVRLGTGEDIGIPEAEVIQKAYADAGVGIPKGCIVLRTPTEAERNEQGTPLFAAPLAHGEPPHGRAMRVDPDGRQHPIILP